jgi:thiol-disulfide isomerase/thioredoxin
MKKLILCGWILSCLISMAQDAGSSTNAADPALSLSEDAQHGAIEIQKMFMTILQSGDATQAKWDAADAKLADYQKQFGTSPATTEVVVQLRQIELTVAEQLGDPSKEDALLQKLKNDPVPEVAKMAQDKIDAEKRVEDLKTNPMDLKFTAVDGTKVDLADMRGKVVLIDFWATWCGPCRMEAPEVVALYDKYHGKGLEVVGISLDQDKDQLLEFTKQQGMVWPQYFDGQMWDNKISKSYGIDSVPTVWLLNRKGLLTAVVNNPEEDLAAQVEKLLVAR